MQATMRCSGRCPATSAPGRTRAIAAVSVRPFRRPAVAVRAASVTELNEKFGIKEHVEVVEGNGGLPKVVLKHSSGSSAEVYLFGGCVTSWRQASGDEVLFVRPDAVFDKSKPISGGIPLCFPQFGPGAIQQHGFARNLDWEIASSSADPQPDERDPQVELLLVDNDYTRAIWPKAFKVVYSIWLHGEELHTEFRVVNTGSEAFEFTGALHTYIEVLGAAKAKVKGLKGLTFLDKTKDPNNPEKKTEERELITFGNGLVDSVYLSAPSHVELDVGTGAAVAVTSEGWPDCVVWNPGETMPACADNFVCVENALASTPASLAPGASWLGAATFAVVDIR